MNLLLIALILGVTSCIGQVPCGDLSDGFNSYTEAVSKVQQATFPIREKITTYQSSWIKEASYYCCDGKKGFFIYTTRDNRTYIHKDVPIEKWEGFKQADSAGEYYNRELRGRYRLQLK